MRRRALFAIALLPTLVIACGISVTGTAAEDLVDDGGVLLPDGSVLLPDGNVVPLDGGSDVQVSPGDARADADGAPLDSSAPDARDADAPDAKEAGPIDDALCLAACKGANRICSNGVCVIDPSGPGKVTCPAGVPCRVICDTKDACKDGVSCMNATSCEILCTGESACMNTGVQCAGTTCDVTCSGKDACKDGVTCTASQRCGLDCTGLTACANNAPTCDTQGSCTINCGGLPGATNSCESGAVTCKAGGTCTVSCQGADSCKNNRVVATAPNVSVTCGNGTTCAGGVRAVADIKATVTCGTGGACAQHIQCFSSECDMECESSQRNACCKPAPNGSNTDCTFDGCIQNDSCSL